MMLRRIAPWALLAAVLLLGAHPAAAQQNGVRISPAGVLSVHTVLDPTGRLRKELMAAATAKLSPEMRRASALRKVSLTRLEGELALLKSRGEEPSADMLHLAGLTGIEYVFYLPETKDIVIAGPAEGYGYDAAGRAVGVNTGKSILLLEDLIAALRAFPAAGDSSALISVSIDPRPEGLARMQQFMAAAVSRLNARNIDQLVAGMKESMGLYDVKIVGVSPQSHFAQVLVEADYRMKLMGIGLERPSVDITSYIEAARPGEVAGNALQRWYFTPNYECVRVTEDRHAMQLVGDGVQLVSEDQVVLADGTRKVVSKADRASRVFVQSFTAHYGELARKEPVYGQMKNLIDMAIAAAFIQEQDFYGQAGWEMAIFGDEDLCSIETRTAPTQVDTAINAVWKGRTLMTPIGGGVNIQARQALRQDRLLTDEKGELARRHGDVVKGATPDHWWWD